MARASRGPLTYLGGLIVLYLALPLVAFFIRFASTKDHGFHVPGLFPSLWVSISCATISLALITLFGLPLAYVLARSKSRVATVVGVIVQIPLALPPIMSGIILIYIVGPYTFLGQLFGERLTESATGIVIAMTFVSAPFLIVAARAAFASLDQGLFDVAKTLGHSDLSRFLRVAIPGAENSIRAGMLLSWLRAFGEYGAVVVLAYNPNSLPVYTYNQFSGVGLRTTLAPTALAIAIAVAAVLFSRAHLHRRVTVTLPDPLPPTLVESAPITIAVDCRVGEFQVSVHHASTSCHVAVLGSSGSGKSTLLREMAGIHARSGLTSSKRSNATGREPVVGYVAQGFTLFPKRTVWRQLLFAKRSTPELARFWLARLRLEGLENRYPSELSGGQRQRVALAQVLCNSPEVLLLDEPFSALDVPVRHELQRAVRQLQRETGLATVIVTHDPEEAAFLSEDVLVIGGGRELQSGSVREVFSRPASREVAQLLDIANLNVATVTATGLLEVDGVLVSADTRGFAIGRQLMWSIRPEHVIVNFDLDEDDHVSLAGELIDVADVGVATDLFVRLAATFEIQARTSDVVTYTIGDHCRVSLSPSAISLWPLETPTKEDALLSAATLNT